MTWLAPINLGLEHDGLVGKIVEIQTVRIDNEGKDSEREYRWHFVGRLVGFTDEFVNDEVMTTTFFMEGAASNSHRVIKIDWNHVGVHPHQQLIQSLDAKEEK